MRATFPVYGLWLGADRIIPGLIPGPADARVDVRVQLGSEAANMCEASPNAPGVAANGDAYDCGRPEVITLPRDGGDGFRLRYDDGTVFFVDRRGTRIWAAWPETLTLEDTAVYLLGPVLAFVLRLRGVTCLHASAFEIDGGAVALVGPSGAGKSTTAAWFAGRGFAVLCDDTLALQERHRKFLVQPGYPRLRLWPEAADILYHTQRPLPRLTPNWDKRYLDLQCDAYRYVRSALPLRAIYVLDERRDDTAAPFVDSSSASAGLLTLLANLRSDCYPDKHSRRREFDTIGRLVQRIPVRRVVARTGSGSLTSLCDTILDDLQSVSDDSIGERKLTCTT